MESVGKSKYIYRPALFEPLAQATDLGHTRMSNGWRGAIGAFTREVSLKQICRLVLDDEELITKVARSSYRHPNGFDKIILYRNEIDGLIKVDVWWEEDDGWGLIHNHRFDFASVVLDGQLQLRHFLTTKVTEENSHDVYRMTVPRAGGDLEPSRRGILQTWEGAMPAGAAYDMECHMFHQAAGTAGMVTCTLVVQGAGRRTYSEVVSDEDPWTDLVAFTPDEVVAKLTRLVNL
jgi:hypothetical protein